MAVIWLVPSALLLAALVLTWRWQQMIDRETDRLRSELRALPVLAEQARALRTQSRRTAGVVAATADFFGSDFRH
jgi:hypothetical protein